LQGVREISKTCNQLLDSDIEQVQNEKKAFTFR
jgi:hypothetical protein